MITITITRTRSGDTFQSNHRTDDEDIAIERAVTRRFGKSAFFHDDRSGGATRRFGQVMAEIKSSGAVWAARDVSGRVMVDVDHS